MKKFMEIPGGVTAAKGFEASGVFCGIRKIKKDIAIIRSVIPAKVAAVFTLNKTLAAPVVLDKLILKRSTRCSAIVANSGNANACTGERGFGDAERMIELTAQSLGIPQNEVLVASTGVIGQYLPMEAIESGIPQAAALLSEHGSDDASEAIMTTDTFAKNCAVRFMIGEKPITIGGIAKGSGMIEPNMATMLAFLTTDANIEDGLLQKIFRRGINRSFNRISVDGDMSTNDMAVILANGMGGNADITEGSPDAELFEAALDHVVISLAKMIARDGEGATKLVEIEVKGAASHSDAVAAARSVANSNLVKTAIHGEDANWGRILAALGYSGVDLFPEQIELSMNNLPILGKNYTILIDEQKAKVALAEKDISLSIDLNQGTDSAIFWTCDLTKEYIHINASYRS
ncbi:MAG: bifunctional glutamate N-acetyltransferase/amino-acid acetyltransferase ArgJ [Bacteroidota bacterium]|nr:bifunctional glutamate N-acetyltransferase/amino-acid acetyltransferase ArgJ [Bacteroidota bacterium]MDP4230977.1 bifunctional glutamate N-acetyltransferase/amino-acid acetyltransferase ArgJ [Bacteroidota bacterium]MDP4235283.1 bifunctional glutamate N-acetyltransferase/amino-acid acetyltransferase ArgJ [Bacteroidota bacterium]